HKARLNQDTGEMLAEGSVRLQDESKTWYGERVEYNFKTQKILATEFRAGQPPYFLKGDALAGDGATQVYVLANGIFTTDDYAEPGYHLHAGVLSIAPGDYIEAKNAVLYFKNTPVFWFPQWRRNLKRHPNHWLIVPGYRSRYGPYLLNTYQWFWNDRFDGAIHLDGRQSRGPGVGPDLNYHLPGFGEGAFKYYYTLDERGAFDRAGRAIEESRQRVWFDHQGTLRTNLTLKAAVRYQTDTNIIHDFFETEYRQNTQPSTFVEFNQVWSDWSLNLLTQPRVNNFQETVERLPDLKLTGLRQRIGPTPLYYESESAFGYYQREFGRNQQEFTSPQTNRLAALRADTFHQVLLPWTAFGWLNITPRAGGRFTYYGEADGPGATTKEEERTVFNTGAEVSFKASRTWPGVQNRFWEINGVRHIVQPSINYVYVPRPDVPPIRLPPFDYELPSTQLLPLTFPDYNSIDSIDSQNVLRFGLENKLQTKRQAEVDNFVHSSLYLDWRLRPRPDQDSFADLYSKLDVKPFPWLTLNSELSYNLNQRQWDQVNHAATFSRNDTWSWTVGHRYLRRGAFYGTNDVYGANVENNLLFSSLYLRFSPNWALRVVHHFDARERVMQSQTYTIYRDLRSWTVALAVRILDNQQGKLDYGGAITFSSKAFPRFDLGDDINKPTLLLGY
ncbi:MAG TPA: LPS assembly protein LptD, partial [Candidatus Binatia bacterium]|nr:LPS assembly protein LptD [Candidatus Binatia bacterium]